MPSLSDIPIHATRRYRRGNESLAVVRDSQDKVAYQLSHVSACVWEETTIAEAERVLGHGWQVVPVRLPKELGCFEGAE